MRQSVFLAQRIPTQARPKPFQATGFVIQENFDGKIYLWGVTAKHITDILGPRFTAVFYQDGKPFSARAQVEYTGSQYGIDLALVSLDAPPDKLRPLTTGNAPQAGEDLTSFGYGRGLFIQTPHRKTIFTGPNRVFTSFAFEKTTARSGLCGSPVLNARGELAAVHCGSRADHSCCVAVPAEHVRLLLNAYRRRSGGTRPLTFNGKVIGQLEANQAVFGVYARSGNMVLSQRTLATAHLTATAEEFADPAHLEKNLSLFNADHVAVLVFREPAETFNLNSSCEQTLYLYNLDTGQVTQYTFYDVLPDY